MPTVVAGRSQAAGRRQPRADNIMASEASRHRHYRRRINVMRAPSLSGERRGRLAKLATALLLVAALTAAAAQGGGEEEEGLFPAVPLSLNEWTRGTCGSNGWKVSATEKQSLATGWRRCELAPRRHLCI